MTKFEAPEMPDDSGDIFDDAPLDDEEPERPELAAVPDDDTEEMPEQEEPAEDSDEEPLLANKYKSVEALEAAYTELQSAFGSRNDEVGQLRSEIAEMRSLLNQEEPDEAPPWWENLEPAEINAAIQQNPGMVFDAIVSEQLKRAVEPRLAEIQAQLEEARGQSQRTAEVDKAYAQVADYWSRHPELKQLEPDVGEYFAENAEMFSDWMFSGDQAKIDKAMTIMTTLVLDRSGATNPRVAAKAKARTAPARGNRNPKPSKDPVARTIEMIRGAVEADGDLFS